MDDEMAARIYVGPRHTDFLAYYDSQKFRSYRHYWLRCRILLVVCRPLLRHHRHLVRKGLAKKTEKENDSLMPHDKSRLKPI